MSRAAIIVRSDIDRDRASRWARKAPAGCVIQFKQSKRTTDQNAKMWAALTDVATQKEHCGRKYTPDQWKVIFLHACGQEVQFIPSLDSSTFIPWGQRSSDLTKDEMSQLLDFIAAWGAENGVIFHEPSAPADAGTDQVARTAPPHSSSDAPQVSETKPAPAEAAPPSLTGAGTSQSSASGTAAAEERQVTEPGASALHGSAGLPEGWRIQYAKALSEAKASRYLKGVASSFWNAHGGWTAHKSGPDAATATAIYDAFENHFSDSEARNAILNELGAL